MPCAPGLWRRCTRRNAFCEIAPLARYGRAASVRSAATTASITSCARIAGCGSSNHGGKWKPGARARPGRTQLLHPSSNYRPVSGRAKERAND
eukprot:6439959-Pyramimonas_sp.AAC.1